MVIINIQCKFNFPLHFMAGSTAIPLGQLFSVQHAASSSRSSVVSVMSLALINHSMMSKATSIISQVEVKKPRTSKG